MTTNSSPSRSLLRGIGVLYILLIVTMAVATIVEHAIGSEATHSMIYGSWWFVGLWAMLVATGTTWLIRQLRRKPISFNTIITFIIHLSLVVILVGAFITHVGSQQGIIHLRGDQPTNLFDNMGSGDAGMTRLQLPFYVKLDRFNVRYHAGTDTPEDYETYFSIIDGHQTLHASVSMNRIFSYRHYRLYQASYDTDNQGSYLCVNYDPWGIGITYTGYGMLFMSLILLLVNPRGNFRRLLRHPLLQKGMFLVAVVLMPLWARATAPAPDRQTAEQFGQLLIHYNGRICPVQTFALDFTQKVYGSHRYHRLTAEQVLMGWLMYPDEWKQEPFIYVKNKKMRRRLGLEAYVPMSRFFVEALKPMSR